MKQSAGRTFANMVWILRMQRPYSQGRHSRLRDDRFDYGEQRFITLGMLKGVVVVIAHTEQDDEIRIISMRKGTKNEQRIYFQGFTN
jgi:uncharacterized DUF497 family protein